MKNLTKIFAALLSLCAITSLLLLGAHAFGETEPIDEVEGEKVDWTYNFTENTLSHGDVVYEEYFMPSGFELFVHEYGYSGSFPISADGLRSGSVTQIMPDPDTPEVYRDIAIMFEPPRTQDRIFVTESGKAIVDAFVNGEYGSYQFAKNIRTRAIISDGDLIDLSERQPNLTIDVKTLRSAQEYVIYGVDQTGHFAHAIGAIYETVDGNGFVYVHFDGLESNYLDADGTLSFRQGEVPAYSVSTSKVTDLLVKSTSMPNHYRSKYSFDDQVDLDQTPALIIFAIMMSPFLYIAPLLLLTLGIVLRSIKKVPSRKRWNSLIILSCLWLVCSLAITALCIVAILM